MRALEKQNRFKLALEKYTHNTNVDLNLHYNLLYIVKVSLFLNINFDDLFKVCNRELDVESKS